MNLFSFVISNLVFIAFTVTVSIGAIKFYNICPPSWFIEYGEKPRNPPDPRIRKPAHIFLYCSLFTLISYILFIRNEISLVLFSGIFTLIFLSYIFISDLKTGIIPDQFISALIFISLFWILSDISISQIPPSDWYVYPLTRISGGILGALVLYAIGFAGSKILKQEAMGMGDIKLIFVSGLITGFPGIFAVIVLSFLMSFPIAVYNLTRRNTRSGIHHPGKLPFGPYITLAVMLLLIFPDEIRFLIDWWLSL